MAPFLRSSLLALLGSAAVLAVMRAASGDALRFVPLVLSFGAFIVARRLWPLFEKFPRKRRLIALFAFALSLRLILTASVRSEPVSDFAVFHELAQALVSGQGYAVTGPAGAREVQTYLGDRPLPYTTAYRAPGTAFWGALLGASVTAFKISNAALGAGTSILIYLLLEECCPAAAAPAALLWALYPAAIFAVNVYGSETLFTFFVTLLAWLAPKRRVRAALAGLVAAWCLLLRPVWMPLAAAGALTFYGKGLRRFGLIAAFAALGVLPWVARDWLIFRRFIPISNETGVVAGIMTTFNAPDGFRDDPARKDLAARWLAADEPGRAALGYKLAMRHWALSLKEGPFAFARMLVRGFACVYDSDGDMIQWGAMNVWDETGGQVTYAYAMDRNWLDLWTAADLVFYLVLIGLACRGLWRKESRLLLEAEGPKLLFWCLLVFSAFFSLLAGTGRYHYFLMVPVCLLAGLGAAPQTAKIAGTR